MTDQTAPVPPDAGPEQTYFRHLREGDWRIPRCTQCRRFCFYPRIVCPACGGGGFDWVRPAGSGTVYSTTVMRRPAQAGGDLNLCLIDLDEGVRMMSRIVDADPGAARIGDRVQAVVPDGDESGRVYFRLAGRAA